MDDRTIKFLDKVLKDLVLDTKLDKLGLHLPFYQYGTIYILQKKEISKVLKNREYKYRDYFYEYVMDTYSLTIEEAFFIYPTYIEMLEDKFDGVKNLNESRDIINEEVMSPVSKHITHKGKLNFIDRITDMIMNETYVTDMEPNGVNSDWYKEGMRKIYFYKGDNLLGRDDEEGVIKPGQSFNEFGSTYSQDTFSAVKSHLKRFGATNIDWNMEIYIWTEYLYRLREKYFGGGEGPPLSRIKKM